MNMLAVMHIFMNSFGSVCMHSLHLREFVHQKFVTCVKKDVIGNRWSEKKIKFDISSYTGILVY